MIYKKGSLPNIFLQFKDQIRKLDDDLFRYLNEQDENLASIFENGINFDENVDGDFVTFTSNAIANTEDSIAHELGKIPTGFIVTALDKGAVIYNGGTVDTKTVIHLKSTVAATTFTIFIF